MLGAALVPGNSQANMVRSDPSPSARSCGLALTSTFLPLSSFTLLHPACEQYFVL